MRPSFQTKIFFTLIGVIVPTFITVTLVQYKLITPLLNSEMRQIGITAGQAIANRITTQRWFLRPVAVHSIEDEINEQVYHQPSILEISVFLKDPNSQQLLRVASNVEYDPSSAAASFPLSDQVSTEQRQENGTSIWNVRVPIFQGTLSRLTPKLAGIVEVNVSNRTLKRLVSSFGKATVIAAFASVVLLILLLNFFLRKTIENERRLRHAEDQNIALFQKLHEAQRQLMNFEKLAVIGQLTANFAHEIGTPLNAISGHLHLLKEESGDSKRFAILAGEVERIEDIVKSFLQTSAKPVSQSQLVDLNKVLAKTLVLLKPRLDSLDVEVEQRLTQAMGPVRVVPLEIEQILLNLLNNAVDSLQSKRKLSLRPRCLLRLETRIERSERGEWACVEIYDTGVGIRKADLPSILRPFYTTKPPGEGTGLGLSICVQLARKYGGQIRIDSKEGAWARFELVLPYSVHA